MIGEPCVGNSAIAEGIKQILAVPKMLETHNCFYLAEGGASALFKRVEKLKVLASQCLARQKGYRVVTLEVANPNLPILRPGQRSN